MYLTLRCTPIAHGIHFDNIIRELPCTLNERRFKVLEHTPMKLPAQHAIEELKIKLQSKPGLGGTRHDTKWDELEIQE